MDSPVVRTYSREFFEIQQTGSRQSAHAVIPILLDWIQPTSAVDVGCGVATWLAVLVEHGVTDVLGVDGDYVDRALLQIPQDRFLVHDLTRHLCLSRRFDLVLCLEVAEHIDEMHAAVLIDSLVGLGPLVLFSAAIPHQGGTHHVNEQWPEYWARFFAERGYQGVDLLRHRIWADPNVEWWYAQNMVLFVERSYLKTNAALLRYSESSSPIPLPLVHPKKYLETVMLLRLARDGTAIVPPGESFILVDDAQFGVEAIPGRSGLPFLEHDGMFWGRPVDDAHAISELERMRRSGSAFIIFCWLSFWWLEYYTGLHKYLRTRFRCVRANECVIAFDLRAEM